MDEEQKRHLSIANSSGFPFQIAAASQIEALRTPWRAILPEHPWHLEETGESGYIDFVLQHGQWGSQRLVVECKRQRGDARWYFFDAGFQTTRTRYVYTQPENPVSLVQDGDFLPSSFSSAYCVMPGEEGGRKPSLERIADQMLQSVEALASEELALDRKLAIFQFLPVLITTARLFDCAFEPSEFSLATGELPDDSKFREIPWIRFSKTLWSPRRAGAQGDVEAAHRARERTLFIVSGHALEEFLRQAKFTA